MARAVSRTTTDHDEIRRWVEERGGWPAEVASTARGDETGIIRIDFPGYSGEGSLDRIDWDEWFEKFDAANLAFVYEDTTAAGQRSNFNKLVGRETAAARARGERTSRRTSRRSSGQRETSARARRASPRRKAGRGAPGRRSRAGAGGRGSMTGRRGGRSAGGARAAGSGGRARRSTPRRPSKGTRSLRTSARSVSRRSTAGRSRGGARTGAGRATAGRSGARKRGGGRRSR